MRDRCFREWLGFTRLLGPDDGDLDDSEGSDDSGFQDAIEARQATLRSEVRILRGEIWDVRAAVAHGRSPRPPPTGGSTHLDWCATFLSRPPRSPTPETDADNATAEEVGAGPASAAEEEEPEGEGDFDNDVVVAASLPAAFEIPAPPLDAASPSVDAFLGAGLEPLPGSAVASVRPKLDAGSGRWRLRGRFAHAPSDITGEEEAIIALAQQRRAAARGRGGRGRGSGDADRSSARAAEHHSSAVPSAQTRPSNAADFMGDLLRRAILDEGGPEHAEWMRLSGHFD